MKPVKPHAVFMTISALAFSIAASAQPAGANIVSAQDLLVACKPLIDGARPNGQVYIPDTQSAGECWGIFAAFQRLGATIDGYTKRPIMNYCMPPAATRSQLIRVFERYTQQYPERLHLSFESVLLHALENAFPCR